jgi:hypothetical protein
MNKPIKVFFHGKRLKDIYPHCTKYQLFKYRVAKFFRRLFLTTTFVSIAIAGLYGSYKAGSHFDPKVVVAEKVVDGSDEMFAEKLNSLKRDVAEKLMACESGGYKDSDGIIIFDSNEKASIGVFQFQKNTVIHYYNVLYGKKITPKEAVMIALDQDKARQLAIDVMFTTKAKASGDWYNCATKHNLDQMIDLIKKMEA